VISRGKRRHPVLNEKAVSTAATRTCEMTKGTYFGDIRYRPFDQDLRTYERHPSRNMWYDPGRYIETQNVRWKHIPCGDGGHERIIL
jgi:hypothetical protein